MTRLANIHRSANIVDGSKANADLELGADVCIIGSGAGGAVVAAVLAEAGVDVLVVEEGAYFSARDFTIEEVDSVPQLYQEAMGRSTSDLGISILQGRAVGGTTVVNWTTSFRTPEDVVAHWADRHHVRGFAHRELGPHFDAIEARLGIHKVSPDSMNPNNRKLFEGCKKLGWEVDTLKRNVVSCMQSGRCGLGCPVNAKRSMLVTMIPDAIDAGARLIHHARVDKLERSGGEIRAAHVTLLDGGGQKPSGKRAKIRANRFILSGGAINSPAVLLRSGINDNGRVGVRTFLHPVIMSIGFYDEPIEAFRGAPQSAGSHHFARRNGKVGFFMEAAPIYPAQMAATMPGFGAAHREMMESLPYMTNHIGITIDGFQDDVPGGVVKLRPSGAPLIDYPIPAPLWEALRFAQHRLAELQFASGAKRVSTMHEPPLTMTSPKDLALIDRLRWEPSSAPVFSAHPLGGCAMGDDARTAVVRSEDLRHHAIRNLHVIDGSVFPTSLGVNPQESIFGLARLMASRIAASHTRGAARTA